MRDEDKAKLVPIVRRLVALGFQIVATAGTSRYLADEGIDNQVVKKIAEGRPHVLDHIKNNAIQLAINTTSGAGTASREIRRTVLRYGVPYSTTMSGAWAMVSAIESLVQGALGVKSVQAYNGRG